VYSYTNTVKGKMWKNWWTNFVDIITLEL